MKCARADRHVGIRKKCSNLLTLQRPFTWQAPKLPLLTEQTNKRSLDCFTHRRCPNPNFARAGTRNRRLRTVAAGTKYTKFGITLMCLRSSLQQRCAPAALGGKPPNPGCSHSDLCLTGSPEARFLYSYANSENVLHVWERLRKLWIVQGPDTQARSELRGLSRTHQTTGLPAFLRSPRKSSSSRFRRRKCKLRTSARPLLRARLRRPRWGSVEPFQTCRPARVVAHGRTS